MLNLTNKKMIGCFVILCLLIGGGAAQAEEIKTLTLDQAIERGLQNNSQLHQLEKSYHQQKQKLQLYKNKYPFNLGIDVKSDYNFYQQEDWLNRTGDSTELAVTNQFSPQHNLVLSQQLIEKNSEDGFEFEGREGSLTYNHYLLKEYNESADYKLGLLTNQIRVIEKKQAVKDFRQQLKLKIVDKYYQLLRLQKKITIKQEMLEQSKLTLKTVQARVEIGEELRIEQQEAALEVEEVKLDLAQLKEEYRLANKELETELKVNLVADVKLTADQLLAINYSETESKQQAVANSLELDLLAKRITKQEYQVQEIAGDKNLNLKLTGQVGWRKKGSPATDYRVGMVLDYHFNNYEEKTDQLTEEQQQVELNKLQEEREDTKQELKLEVERSWVELTGYKNKENIYQQAIDRAEDKLAIKREKYKNGLATLNEVLAAQVDLRQKKVDYVNNLINYNQQVYELKKLLGQL